MALKIVFVVVCLVVMVNSFTMERSDGSKSLNQDSRERYSHDKSSRIDQQTKEKRNDHLHHEDEHSGKRFMSRVEDSEETGGQQAERFGYPDYLPDGTTGSFRRRFHSARPYVLDGQQLRMHYKSSEEVSSDNSLDYQKIQKQYHDTIPYDYASGRSVYNKIQPRAQKVMTSDDTEQQDQMRNHIERGM